MGRFRFPRQTAKRGGAAFGFQTGDIVRLAVSGGKFAGTHISQGCAPRKRFIVVSTEKGKVETNYNN
jgi:hypothetical protein